MLVSFHYSRIEVFIEMYTVLQGILLESLGYLFAELQMNGLKINIIQN